MVAPAAGRESVDRRRLVSGRRIPGSRLTRCRRRHRKSLRPRVIQRSAARAGCSRPARVRRAARSAAYWCEGFVAEPRCRWSCPGRSRGSTESVPRSAGGPARARDRRCGLRPRRIDRRRATRGQRVGQRRVRTAGHVQAQERRGPSRPADDAVRRLDDGAVQQGRCPELGVVRQPDGPDVQVGPVVAPASGRPGRWRAQIADRRSSVAPGPRRSTGVGRARVDQGQPEPHAPIVRRLGARGRVIHRRPHRCSRARDGGILGTGFA